MDKILSTFDSERSATKYYIGSIFLLLILGALSTGLWELLFWPLFQIISNFTLRSISFIFSGYLDFTYQTVSKDIVSSLSLSIYHLLISAFFSLLVGIFIYLNTSINRILKGKKQIKSEETILEEYKKLKHSLYKHILPLLILLAVLMSHDYLSNIHRVNAGRFIDNSLEIVAPYISEMERLQLRSNFRSIESAADFYRLEDRLMGIAKDHSLKLPKFESIR